MKLLFAIFLLALPAYGDRNRQAAQGSVDDIRWGRHWAGPVIQGSSELKGKVTLLVIWGG